MAELILIRHAEAEELKTTDAARRLTKKGHKQANYLSRVLNAEIPQVDLFVHSGIKRAEQTLQLTIAKKARWNIMTTASLKHEAKAIEFAKWLQVHADDLEKVIAIGHEPHLSRFVAWAVARSSQAHFEIKKGAIVRLEIIDFDLILKRRMKLTELVSIKQLKSSLSKKPKLKNRV